MLMLIYSIYCTSSALQFVSFVIIYIFASPVGNFMAISWKIGDVIFEDGLLWGGASKHIHVSNECPYD